MGKTPNQSASLDAAARSRIPACDACRFRKVKCPRTSMENTCSRCLDKNIRCLTTNPGKATRNRSGKRIEEARVKFGAAEYDIINDPATIIPNQSPANILDDSNIQPELSLSSALQLFPASSSSSMLGIVHNEERDQADYQEQHQLSPVGSRSAFLMNDISPSGAQNRLSIAELSNSLASHLVELFFSTSHYFSYGIAQIGFLEEFYDSGCRIDSLADPMAKVLSYAIIALSARTSDHPLLLGSSAPKFKEIAQMTGVDLTPWGSRRQIICKALSDHALKKCDEHGALRKPHRYSMLACAMMDELCNYADSVDMDMSQNYDLNDVSLDHAVTGDKGRAFASAAVNHLRQLAEEYHPDADLKDSKELPFTLVKCVMMRDVGVSVAIGRFPHINSYDFEMFFDEIECLKEMDTKKFQDAILKQIDSSFVEKTCMTMITNACFLSRKMVKKLNGPAARRRPKVDIEALENLIDLSSQYFGTLCENLRILYMCGSQDSSLIAILTKMVLMVTMGECHRAAIFHHIICDRLPDKGQNITYFPTTTKQVVELTEETPTLQDNVNTNNYVEKLGQLKEESKYRMLFVSMKAVQLMQETLAEAGGEELLGVCSYLLIDMRLWTDTLIRTPSAENGGPMEYPEHEKQLYLKNLLTACLKLGWAWPETVYSIKALQNIGVVPSDRFVKLTSRLCSCPSAYAFAKDVSPNGTNSSTSSSSSLDTSPVFSSSTSIGTSTDGYGPSSSIPETMFTVVEQPSAMPMNEINMDMGVELNKKLPGFSAPALQEMENLLFYNSESIMAVSNDGEGGSYSSYRNVDQILGTQPPIANNNFGYSEKSFVELEIPPLSSSAEDDIFKDLFGSNASLPQQNRGAGNPQNVVYGNNFGFFPE